MDNCQNLMEQLNKQNKLYQPGIFWQEASKVMVEDLTKNGIKKFRRVVSSLSFFVPTYGFPSNGLSKATSEALNEWIKSQNLAKKQTAYLTQFATGYSAALADFRTLKASEYGSKAGPDLLEFSESQVGDPIEQFEIEDNYYSRSSLNYLSGLSFLKKHTDISKFKAILEIGGGFGTLGEITHQTLPNTQYINIDIPPTLCCSAYYLQQIAGEDKVTTFNDIKENNLININKLKKISTLPSWTIENLQGEVDLFVNFISFQEMEPDIVQNYLNNVTRLQAEWILLRNLREGKQLRSQHRFGVDKPVFSEDYQQMLPDYDLVETNVYPYGYKTVDGFHSEIMLFKRR